MALDERPIQQHFVSTREAVTLKITSKSSDEAVAEDKRIQERQAREAELKTTAKLIEPVADALRQLPKDQLEELVLWLKTLHNPQPDWDVERQETERFVKKLEGIRDSSDQHKFQMNAAKSNVWAIACGVGAGVLASLAVGTGPRYRKMARAGAAHHSCDASGRQRIQAGGDSHQHLKSPRTTISAASAATSEIGQGILRSRIVRLSQRIGTAALRGGNHKTH